MTTTTPESMRDATTARLIGMGAPEIPHDYRYRITLERDDYTHQTGVILLYLERLRERSRSAASRVLLRRPPTYDFWYVLEFERVYLPSTYEIDTVDDEKKLDAWLVATSGKLWDRYNSKNRVALSRERVIERVNTFIDATPQDAV